jgi:hypothetical protein
LHSFDALFSRPQFEHFVTVLVALLMSLEGQTLSHLHRAVAGKKSLSSMSRFLSQAPWSHRDVIKCNFFRFCRMMKPKIEQECQKTKEQQKKLKRRGRQKEPLVTGYLIGDDSTLSKTKGVKMQGLGRHHSTTYGKRIIGHSLVQCLSTVLGRFGDVEKRGTHRRAASLDACDMVRKNSLKDMGNDKIDKEAQGQQPRQSLEPDPTLSDALLVAHYHYLLKSTTFQDLVRRIAASAHQPIVLKISGGTSYTPEIHTICVDLKDEKGKDRTDLTIREKLFVETLHALNRDAFIQANDLDPSDPGPGASLEEREIYEYKKARYALMVEWYEWIEHVVMHCYLHVPINEDLAGEGRGEALPPGDPKLFEKDGKGWLNFHEYLWYQYTVNHTFYYDKNAKYDGQLIKVIHDCRVIPVKTGWKGWQILQMVEESNPASLAVTLQEVRDGQTRKLLSIKPLSVNPFASPEIITAALHHRLSSVHDDLMDQRGGHNKALDDPHECAIPSIPPPLDLSRLWYNPRRRQWMNRRRDPKAPFVEGGKKREKESRFSRELSLSRKEEAKRNIEKVCQKILTLDAEIRKLENDTDIKRLRESANELLASTTGQVGQLERWRSLENRLKRQKIQISHLEEGVLLEATEPKAPGGGYDHNAKSTSMSRLYYMFNYQNSLRDEMQNILAKSEQFAQKLERHKVLMQLQAVIPKQQL